MESCIHLLLCSRLLLVYSVLCMSIIFSVAGRLTTVNYFQKDDSQFSLLRSALDARMKELTRQNVGTLKKHAQVVTADMETSFWEKGVFGSSSAQTLLDTLFFYSCKLFGMRSGDEH